MVLVKGKAFIDQVISEARKITWPNKKEVISTTIIVIVVVALFALFFMLADSIIYKSIQYILKIGS